MNKTMMNIEWSPSFKDWVSAELKVLEASDHTFESSDSTSSMGRNRETLQINEPTTLLPEVEPTLPLSSRPVSELHAAATKIQRVYKSYRTRCIDAAATKIQKVYKSYRTRRNLADCAVVDEEQWWKALDSGARKRSSESLNIEKHDIAESRWARTRARAGQVRNGLSKDKQALQHWLEAIDPRHRHGLILEFYYNVWYDCDTTQPFFYWLDIGEGRDIKLIKCPRTDLQRQRIRYLGLAMTVEWTFLLVGLCLEILSIAFDQASSPSRPQYALFGMILAIAALLICIWELIYKGKKERVELRRRGKFWWFYYPHSTQLFGMRDCKDCLQLADLREIKAEQEEEGF